ncbi:MAG: TolC family protein, partial [Verrucomicrobiota bacterium]
GVGNALASQLLLAEADVATAQDSLEARRELVGRASRQLEVLAGRYPSGRAGSEARLPPYPGSVPAGLPATLLDRRPDLGAAERRIAAADQLILEAKRAMLPAISLTGSVGTSSEDIADLLDSDLSVWSIAGNLAQPILQGGRLRQNVERRKAELILAAAEFEEAALTAFSEVENALAAEQFFNRRVSALIRATSLAEDAYDRASEEYVGGTGDLLTVLTAQQRVFSSQSQLLTLRRQRLDNRVDLYLALGGSFEPYPLAKAELSDR